MDSDDDYSGLLPGKLEQENYHEWILDAQCYLLIQGIWELVTGKWKAPKEDADERAKRQWDKANALFQVFLKNALRDQYTSFASQKNLLLRFGKI